MKLNTERLLIRELKKEDIENLFILVNDLDVSQYLAVVPYPYTKKDGEWFVNNCKEESKKNPRENYELAIELKDTKRLIGVIGLTKVNKLDEKATIGYWLGKKYWRKGIMYEAVMEVIRFGFEDLKLQRIEISASTENEASNNLIKKLGAKYEGTARRGHRTKSTGKFHDINNYGLLKEDFDMCKKK
jgi:RimJ/RimL family protein N-acetyltransferase